MLIHGKMKEFFSLVRWKNLMIVVFTMIMMRYGIIEPLLGKASVILLQGSGEAVPMELQFRWFDFAILVVSTVLITAGGYVINDYFDIKTDLINKGKVIVGTRIPRRKAIMWHNILNIVGVTGGFYVSWKAGYFWLGTIFLLVSGLLYFYSASYKRQLLIGNIIVALLTALVPFIVVVYEWPAVYRFYSLNAVEVPDLDFLLYWVGGFSFFAFLITIAREIIKDIEDFEGDMAYGRNTVPVILGINSTKIVAICLIIITILLLYLAWYFFINDIITLIYLSVTVAMPLLFIIFRILKSRDKSHIHYVSNSMKIVMMTGILYSLVVKIIITWNLL